MTIGYHGDVVPHAALVHGDRPGGIRHGMVIVCRSGVELHFLTIGNGGKHSPLLRFADAVAVALTGHQAHPSVGNRPFLGEVVQELQGIAVPELLAVNGSAADRDEVRTGLGGHAAVISVEYQAAGIAGHAVSGEIEVVLPVRSIDVCGGLARRVELHLQVIAVAGLILNDQCGVGNLAFGVFLLKFPVGDSGLAQIFADFCRQCRWAKSQHHYAGQQQ